MLKAILNKTTKATLTICLKYLFMIKNKSKFLLRIKFKPTSKKSQNNKLSKITKNLYN